MSRGLTRALREVEVAVLRGGGCGVAVSLGRRMRRRRRRGGVHAERGSGRNETVKRTHLSVPSSHSRDKVEIAQREANIPRNLFPNS